MQTIDFEGAKTYAIKRLSEELDNRIVYHCLSHTFDDVLPATEALALAAGIEDGSDDLLLLRTAAMYHDMGFLIQRHEHEAAGIEIAQSILPTFGYSQTQIDRISGMIQATHLPQSPRNFFEQIIADADLDVLGHSDFLARNQKLRIELANFDTNFTDLEWYSGQLKFITHHQYFTDVAQQKNQHNKQSNINLLRQQIAQLDSN